MIRMAPYHDEKTATKTRKAGLSALGVHAVGRERVLLRDNTILTSGAKSAVGSVETNEACTTAENRKEASASFPQV